MSVKHTELNTALMGVVASHQTTVGEAVGNITGMMFHLKLLNTRMSRALYDTLDRERLEYVDVTKWSPDAPAPYELKLLVATFGLLPITVL